MSTYIFGHTNPDSDSIIGAISLAYLKNQLGEDCVPTRQGDISPETEFILKRFGAEEPELKTSYAGEKVYLVDFSDLAQAPKDIKEATILGIVDHHKLGDITTDTPLECWIRPIGCSNTVIKEMFDYYGVAIPKNLAGMMMCAILSDTVIFKSPTCTKADTKAVKDLAKISHIDDYKALGMEMFIAKSAIEGASARDLNMRDYKAFDMNGTKVGIGQLEMVDISALNDRIGELFADMKLIKQEEGLHTIIILLTDIMKEGSQLLVLSDDVSKVEKAFNVKIQDNQAWLDGVLSRKKQVIPFLQPQF
ncbi:manganese-dependent inorganic pyrophosphatase [Sulfurimonas xiamenensis]|jgi:manganese-dependent inorganic pyrophosphatase|uniref:inorganic diphosphatase n=1 Tax=Sulfurimonas xiamenensis TaxID=2590021 RepID=A0AAJ4DMP5_9BACT|nr:manganese-dependent inorganic pyrophosphatase [Sulfurimonas xiamenensis]PLY13666.1 MAG: manganese-dependent inorganic pyrophosphatase [Sulfurimonas sp.]QFR43236.1 manganese-dependent inorganic pyrophosphatase [Sulfurimonas xiamenensis]